MQIRKLAATLLALSLFLPFTCAQADAQQAKRKNKNEKQGSNAKKHNDEEDIESPVDMGKFPGVGSIDSWKTSVPEFREGMTKMKAHRWDEAIAHFRASIALYEYQPKAFLQIGKAIEAKDGLVADAEKAYRQCVKLDNQSWQGWRALANVLYLQKRYDEARTAVSNALNLNPPAKARQTMGKMVQMIDAGQKDSDTQGRDAAN
jgi:tetratricopeptide (TPR) repeat protein